MSQRRSQLRSAANAVLWGIVASLVLPLAAQRYTYRQYGPQQGLTNLVVHSLFQDKVGYLWIGTDNGLFRYDGNGFRGYFRRHGLPSQSVLNLSAPADGSLWVATPGGIARWDGARFIPVDAGAAPVAHVAPGFDSAGHVYVVRSGGLARADDARAPKFSLIAPGKLSALYVTGDHVWFARDNDLLRLAGDRAEPFGVARGLPAETWKAIIEDAAGTLWVRSSARLFALPKGATRFVDRSAQGAPCNAVACGLAADPSGAILVPGDTGVVTVGSPNPVAIDAAHGLPVQTVKAALVTRDGSLWLGSFGGGLLRRLGRGEWVSWQKEDGSRHSTIWAIERDRQGHTWLGSNGGLAQLDAAGRVARTWTRRDGLAGDRVDAIVTLPGGGVVVATRPLSLAHIDSSGQIRGRFGLKPGLADGSAVGMGIDVENRLWVAANGACLRSTESIEPRGTQETLELRLEKVEIPGVDGPDILGITADRTSVLVGTRKGLLRFAQGSWRAFTTSNGLLSNAVGSAIEKDGVIWLRYYDSLGMARMHVQADGVKLDHFNSSNGLGSDAVFGMAYDGHNRLWVSTDNGADVLANGRWRHFGAEDGLISNDCDEGALFADDDGVWIGTSNGVSRHALARSFAESAPGLVFTTIESGSHQFQSGEKLALAYWQQSLRVQFGSLDFFREAELRFRYRLEGEDQGWIDTREHSVQYRGLPPGRHRFEVVAAGSDGRWGEPLRLEFSIATPWWLSWWFRTLALLALAGIARVFWSVRVRMLVAQNEALEKRVVERTAQLHESHRKLEQIAYHDSLTELPNRRMFAQEFERRIAQASRHGESFALLLIDLDRFKPINDEYGHDAGDAVLVETARRLQEAVRAGDCVARLGGDEFAVLLTHLEDERAVELTCARIAGEVAREMSFRGLSLHIGLSTGAAMYPEHGRTQGSLYRSADVALYAAKRRERGASWLMASTGVATD